jgi:Response regulator containing a CheY-like receiver domain and an HTH DNA-binding domain
MRIPPAGARIDALCRRGQDAVGPDEWAVWFRQGEALSLAQAVAYAQRARGSRTRATRGWASLTPTERQVVGLTAAGLTNPLIGQHLLMSRSTVKTHLAHIYAKLGITSRTELAATAARRMADET